MNVVVNVVELNRRRHVELESVTLALAEAIAAGERANLTQLDGRELEPVRELRRALSALVTQPLPEALMADAGTGELMVELEAPAHELEQLADELEQLADTQSSEEPFQWGSVQDQLEALAARLRHRALTRS